MSIASISPLIPLQEVSEKSLIVHHVFFWLKNPANSDKLLEGLKTLRGIPQVKALWIGQPASTEKREVVDNSYHVSELMHFESLAAQKTYQDHPVHQKFIADYSQLWEKVVVYDTIMDNIY